MLVSGVQQSDSVKNFLKFLMPCFSHILFVFLLGGHCLSWFPSTGLAVLSGTRKHKKAAMCLSGESACPR